MAYNELKQRGTADFPVEYFYIDRTHPRYNMSAHWHSEIEMIRILSGELEIKLNNNEYYARKGDIVFVNSETVHQATPKDCVYECVVCHIDFLYNNTYSCRFFIENILKRDYIIKEYSPCEDSEYHSSVNDIFEAVKNKSSGYKFRAIAAFYKFFGVVTDKHLYTSAIGNNDDAEDKKTHRLKATLSFMRSNYDKQVSLEDMARVTDMSVKYFGTFFKTMTQKTPFEYLNEYRIEKACLKLLHTDLSVTEIAYSCGFNDLSYFIKTFKRIKGIPPFVFRKK